MALVLHIESQNENNQRQYPFLDDCVPTSMSGFTLPLDAIIDASITAVGGGSVFLSEITLKGELVFSRVGGEEVGRGIAEPGLVMLFSPELSPCGAVMLGYGWDLTLAAAPLNFSSDNTTLSPSCIVPVPDSGLVSLKPDQGSTVSGDVEIVPGPGVRVTAKPDTSAIRVDFEGYGPNVDPCTNLHYIRKLCFEVWKGSMITPSDNDGAGTVAVSYLGMTLPEACVGAKIGKLPDSEGNLPGSAEYGGLLMSASVKAERELMYAFEVDVATANGCVTLVSFAASGEEPSRLSIKGNGDGTISITLLGGRR